MGYPVLIPKLVDVLVSRELDWSVRASPYIAAVIGAACAAIMLLVFAWRLRQMARRELRKTAANAAASAVTATAATS